MRGSWIDAVVVALMVAEHAGAQERGLPRFDDYLTADTVSSELVAPDLTSPGARQFQSVLTLAAQGGPNFAGHYTVAVWGCGTSCQSFAIIDVNSGAVEMGGFTLSVGAEYRRNSGLFITNPPEAWREAYGDDDVGAVGGRARTEYFHWNGEELVRLACVPLGENSRC